MEATELASLFRADREKYGDDIPRVPFSVVRSCLGLTAEEIEFEFFDGSDGYPDVVYNADKSMPVAMNFGEFFFLAFSQHTQKSDALIVSLLGAALSCPQVTALGVSVFECLTRRRESEGLYSRLAAARENADDLLRRVVQPESPPEGEAH